MCEKRQEGRENQAVAPASILLRQVAPLRRKEAGNSAPGAASERVIAFVGVGMWITENGRKRTKVASKEGAAVWLVNQKFRTQFAAPSN
jgi:hypothetical protein